MLKCKPAREWVDVVSNWLVNPRAFDVQYTEEMRFRGNLSKGWRGTDKKED